MAPVFKPVPHWRQRIPGRLPWSVTRGLTNRWPLDDASAAPGNNGVVQDIVGNLYATNSSSNAPFSIDGPERSRALRFAAGGTLNNCTWPSPPGPSINGTPLTVAFWVWLDQFNATDGFDPRLVATGTAAYPVVVASAADGSYIGFFTPTGASDEVATTGLTLVLNQWQHIVVTTDGNNGGSHLIYYNGVKQTTGAGHGDTPAGSSTFGSRGDSARGLVGRMADLRFYTGTILTGAEVNELYNSAFTTETFHPDQWEALLPAAASGFIPAWAMNSNRPVIGTGTY